MQLSGALASPKFLPTVMIAIDVASAARYALARSPKHVVYWLAAAVLTYSITWMDR